MGFMETFGHDCMLASLCTSYSAQPYEVAGVWSCPQKIWEATLRGKMLRDKDFINFG